MCGHGSFLGNKLFYTCEKYEDSSKTNMRESSKPCKIFYRNDAPCNQIGLAGIQLMTRMLGIAMLIDLIDVISITLYFYVAASSQV